MTNNSNVLRLGAVVTIAIGILYFMGNAIISNNEMRVSEDRRLEEKYNDLQKTSNDGLHRIDRRLGRIEDRLGVKRD